MMLTEQEAREKLCFRVFGGVVESKADAKCLGSGCMAWRWELGKPNGGYSGVGTAWRDPPPHGYCGLAGKP